MIQEFLLDPGQSELSVTVVVLEGVPAHHVQDVEGAGGLAVDAVQDGEGRSPAQSVAPRQVAGETLHLQPALTEHLGLPSAGYHQVPPTLREEIENITTSSCQLSVLPFDAAAISLSLSDSILYQDIYCFYFIIFQ